MVFLTSRRVGTTYGRTTKRVLVHDIFEHRSGAEETWKTTAPKPSPPPTLSDDQQLIEISTSDATQKLVRHEPYVEDLSPVIPDTSNDVKARHPQSISNIAAGENDMFDIKSSEEDEGEEDGRNLKARKRQRIGQPSRKSRTGSTKQAATLAQKSGNTSARSTKLKPQDKQQPVLQTQDEHLRRETVVRRPNGKTTASSKPSNTGVEAPRRLKSRSAPHAEISINVPTQLAIEDTMLVDDYASTDASGHPTDFSSMSIASLSATPKRKRLASQSSDEMVSSPSQLGIRSLRLTPEKSGVSSRVTSPGLTSDEGETPRRVRPRLIDRLDGPVTNKTASSDNQGEEKRFHDRGKTPDSQRLSRGRVKVQRHVDTERSQSSQSRATYATKARTTYAKERSHLSDMVDSLDSLSGPSSQHSSQGLLLQATTSNLASTLDLDDDEGDNQSGTKIIKSIHELRQAGAMSRFDREVQTLLEDVGIQGQSSKASRLRALMKLTRRLGDEAFLTYFVSSGRTARLATCCSSTLDIPSTLLFTVALFILSKAENSLEGLTCIFDGAVSLAPKMLKIHTSLSQQAQNPVERLSKGSIKELTVFEQYLVETKPMSTIAKSEVYADSLILVCLDETLRSMIRLGGNGPKMSTVSYTEILQLLERHAQRLAVQQQAVADTTDVESALSLLEVCSMAFDSMEDDIQAVQYQELGESLATIMRFITEEQSNLGQSILKAVVSLTNGKPKMCYLLGQTSITDAVFHIIDKNFVIVADRAEHEQMLDQAKLDSVILALGCLLNFSECDSESRKKVAHGTAGGLTYLERLVTIFNSQVDKIQEVTTSEQSQVLVAVGYLSMLLCTMSLDRGVRMQITEQLKDKSFEELCVAAETFFSHLRTLENISDDDASMRAFTARFSSILATIRGATMWEG